MSAAGHPTPWIEVLRHCVDPRRIRDRRIFIPLATKLALSYLAQVTAAA